MKGKRVGVEQGANAALILAKALQQAGLSANDIIQVPLAIGDHLDAWRHDKVDAVVTYEPASSQLLKQGAVSLFDSKQMPDTIVDVLAFRAEVLTESYTQAIRHLIAAHFRALAFFRQQPDEAAKRMADHLNLPHEQVLNSFAGMVLPDASENHRLLSGALPPLIKSAQVISSFMAQSRLLPQEDSLSGLVSAAYLPLESPS